MAIVTAQFEVDSFAADLNFYSRNFYEDLFYDDLYYQLGGRTYQDVYVINAYDGYDDLILGFGGTGLRFNAWGDIIGGTVTGIIEMAYDGPEILRIENIRVSAVTLYRAGLTAGNADDRAVIAGLLSGNDTIRLSAYDDRFEGWAGNDQMFGQGGNDTLIGGSGSDLLDGGSGADRLVASDGLDRLVGGFGNDLLEGGTGSDSLEGGLGRDQMHGGADSVRDVFVFRTASESAPGSQRDSIMQFRAGQDDIDLSLIDAHSGRSGNQAFAFAGTTAAAHAVWYAKQAGGVMVMGDVNGNKIADFQIWVDDATRLGATDFIL